MSSYSLGISGVDKITSGLVESIQKSEALLFIHAAHPEPVPLITDAHGTKTNRGDMETGNWC